MCCFYRCSKGFLGGQEGFWRRDLYAPLAPDVSTEACVGSGVTALIILLGRGDCHVEEYATMCNGSDCASRMVTPLKSNPYIKVLIFCGTVFWRKICKGPYISDYLKNNKALIATKDDTNFLVGSAERSTMATIESTSTFMGREKISSCSDTNSVRTSGPDFSTSGSDFELLTTSVSTRAVKVHLEGVNRCMANLMTNN